MAMSRELEFSPSSVRSSPEAAESVRGTPEVQPMTRSLDGNIHRSGLRSCRERLPTGSPSMPRSQTNSSEVTLPIDKDPFVTPIRGTRLSPTASAFTPFTEVEHIPSRCITGPTSNVLSSELGLSRTLQVSSEKALLAAEVEAWLSSIQDRDGLNLCGNKLILASAGKVLISFSDIRDSTRVKDGIGLIRKDLRVDFIDTHKSLRGVVEPQGHEVPASGQVLVIVTCTSPFESHDAQMWDTVIGILESYGPLFAFVNRTAFSDGTFQAIAEFCNTAAASRALQMHHDGLPTMGIRITIKNWSLDPLYAESALVSSFRDLQTPSSGHDNNLSRRDTSDELTRTVAAHMGPGLPMYPFLLSSQLTTGSQYMFDRFPGHAQTVPLGPLSPMTPLSSGYRMMRSFYHSPPSPALTSQHSSSPSRAAPGFIGPDGRRQNATRVTRTSPGGGSHHNHVDTGRIREGIDVRTTIMLRNIPNKVDQAMLKRLVDESSWGKYDFMYLRIDFANDCNVGYAFINFVDPLDIVDFVEARGNQRWNCFKSDKVAEISYATIQGKDCLVQKFRNSSVMLEALHYRPKLFFTSNGPVPELAGQEEPFPEPDNQSKMKRSCENAEHVGLFTPNAGQHFRDEQRRRRSQYDRGTRLAALEEYDYDTTAHLCGAN